MGPCSDDEICHQIQFGQIDPIYNFHNSQMLIFMKTFTHFLIHCLNVPFYIFILANDPLKWRLLKFKTNPPCSVDETVLNQSCLITSSQKLSLFLSSPSPFCAVFCFSFYSSYFRLTGQLTYWVDHKRDMTIYHTNYKGQGPSAKLRGPDQPFFLKPIFYKILINLTYLTYSGTLPPSIRPPAKIQPS